VWALHSDVRIDNYSDKNQTLHNKYKTNSCEQTQRQADININLLVEWVEEDNGLDGLAKTHLIGQYSIDVMRPGIPQPVDTLQLVRV